MQNLLLSIENFYLEYRDTLNLPINLTFGVELEYESLSRNEVDDFIKYDYPNWTSKSDFSLMSGGEITSPIMHDDIVYWKQLKKICQYLDKNKADTLHNAGGHIHIGQNILNNDAEAWKSFLKLYMAYENVLLRFMYGDKKSARKNLIHYAQPVADNLYEHLKEINEATDFIDIYSNLPMDVKYYCLNFKNVHLKNNFFLKQTLEFRGPNASSSEIIWQNNINTFSKMLLSAHDKVMNIDFLDYKLKHEYIPYYKNPYMYSEVNLKNALESCPVGAITATAGEKTCNCDESCGCGCQEGKECHCDHCN